MKEIKYVISLILSTLSIVCPAFGILYILSARKINWMIAGILFVWIIFIPIINSFRTNARYIAKADEFGMISDFSYNKMSVSERREFDKERAMQMERLLSQSAVKKMTHKGPEDPEREITTLIGLSPVKIKMKQIIARAKFDQENGKKNTYSGHFVFYGSPGTGKTTVARILASFLYQNKCIKENKIIECDGNTLKGSAPGEAAQKVEILVKKAFGGVLFIDEAYAMADNYTSEGIDTLIKLMEDYRDRFILIMAGYTEPMDRLLEKNPGFRSRIKEYIVFPDYNTQEANAIFQKMANEQNLVVDADALALFEERYCKEKKEKNFGNARTIRNILEESISNHAYNLMENVISKDNKYRLCKEDISINCIKI